MHTCPLTSFFGPRVPMGELRARPFRYVLPIVFMLAAAALLLLSFKFEYWSMTLFAPQYPKGLHVSAYLNRLVGDVAEIDGLNHYIGMRSLNDAAQLEREFSFMAIIAMSGLLLCTLFIHSKWSAAFALPALLFPAGFLADLHFWLNHFGQNLDPTAALSSSIKPFTPPVLGEGVIGQFRTVAVANTGWWMAVGASALVIAGLYFHRRAFKPLVDRCESEVTVPGAAKQRCLLGGVRSASTSTVAAFALSALITFAASAHTAGAGQLQHQSAARLQSTIDAAAAGSVVTITAGTYTGPITIDRSITLEADGIVIIDGGGNGDVVRITAPNVVFRGFIVRSSGSSIEGENAAILALAPHALIENNRIENALFGISLKQSSETVIRNNVIVGKKLDIARRGDAMRIWQSNNVLIEDNTVSDSRDVVMWFADGVTLRRNHVVRCRYGMHFMYTHDNVLEDNRLEDNSVGAFLMYSRNLEVRRNVFARNRGPSGYGLGLKDMQGILAEDNVFLGNRVGAYLDNPPTLGGEFDTFTRNVFAFNDLGLAFQPMVKQIAFTENTFKDNIQQVAVMSGGKFSGNKFSVEGKGNFWSDYRGFDIDRDGIGDMPFLSDSLFENLMDREPAMRLFLYSPAQQAIELASRAFPVMQPDPKVTDDSPLMSPVLASVNVGSAPSNGMMWLTAAGLLGCAGVSLLAARPQYARSARRGAA